MTKSDLRSKKAFYIIRNVKKSNTQTLREVRSGEIADEKLVKRMKRIRESKWTG